ncbi:hypothetical protein [Jidongwangia harbinensis]|uniref:hypothetical protein n=1 Tax=Jidongwangia harbinensis TaxID=2878561 RepID=UPI001CDA53F8|nr:hypothetical protein [Jidongwangia harbinensis]MCA2216321.1 hypothetical protein [Jidongwangia harbinensis]MCA2217056.1 hypothetical protein [Jidongwangia harbinensis]
MPLGEAGVLGADVLPAVGMKSETVGGTPPGEGVAQGGVDQVGFETPACCAACSQA